MSLFDIEWDPLLIEKYDSASPRYTSYPTAVEFHPQFTDHDFQQEARRYPARPLSLYVHIPFCHQLCYFCACNKTITRHKEKAQHYLAQLATEIATRAPLFRARRVTQLHLGGGTPTYLDDQQLTALIGLLRQHFHLSERAEISLELDPRHFSVARLAVLRRLGFNRLSMGVQDFNPQVQQRVNREQDEAQIGVLITAMRSLGFTSGNIDLIYGLPLQTADSFAYTVERIIALRPDRLSVFNYAHMPTLFAAQRKIICAELPSAQVKLDILQQTIRQLRAGGYQFIGMDHFALPEDELAKAQRTGQLHRNFQGYTTQQQTDLLGLGVSAISMVGDSYGQNDKSLKGWTERIQQQGQALVRGMQLSEEDGLRRDIITALLCQFTLDIGAVEARVRQPFSHYFATEMRLLAPMIEDGLVTISTEQLRVTPRGRLLVRHICACFDQYSHQRNGQSTFSRVI